LFEDSLGHLLKKLVLFMPGNVSTEDPWWFCGWRSVPDDTVCPLVYVYREKSTGYGMPMNNVKKIPLIKSH
jgi:hypothetical protein